MVNMKSVDLTNPTQKSFAFVMIAILLVVLYFLLPPLILIFTNIWIFIAIAAPLVFFGYNYQMVWSYFKRLSWNMTKKIISSDPLWHMYQYYHYMTGKLEDLNDSIRNIGAIEVETSRAIQEMLKQLEDLKRKAIQAAQNSATQGVMKLLNGKVGLLQQQTDNLLPRLEFIKKQKQSLIELHDAWGTDTELLKATLDGKAQEYKMMLQMNKATNTAYAFLQKDSPELQEYKQSLVEIESSVAQYTSNMENFQREVAPQLSRMSAASDINAADGAALIEKYKQERLALK